MLRKKSIGVGLWLMTGFVSVLCAQDQPPGPLPADDDERLQPAPMKARPKEQQFERIQPRLGRGYVPYSYPAIDSCPCASDGCFHPARYFYGGKEYRRSWRRRWLRAHFGHGSMLDGYRCECIFPTAGRPYLRTVNTGTTSELELPPDPPEPDTKSPY